MPIFLYIDVDAFFASVEQSINPTLMGRPVMVGGLKHERGVVACPSYEARRLGVRTGTTLYRAAQLIPNGVFLRGDFNRYQYYSDRFYQILNNYSPDIQKISQDEACFDIGHDVSLGEYKARQLQQEVWDKLTLSTSIGLGPSRVSSKIASEHKKPMGITVVTPKNLKIFFADLPIRRLPGVGSHTENILHEMGIRTAGQLAQVPEEYLKTIFGINGLKISAYSRGLDGLPFRDYRVIRSVSRETGFADDITSHDILLSHYSYLLERATAKLRTIDRKAANIKIKFRYADFQSVEVSSCIAGSSNDENYIFPLVEKMFRRFYTRRLGIRFIGIVLSGLKTYVDNETFLNDRIEKNGRLLKTLDSTRRRTGFFSIMTGRTLSLASRYKKGDTGYELRTPGLSQ